MKKKIITDARARQFVEDNWLEIALNWASELDKNDIVAVPPGDDQALWDVMFIRCHRRGDDPRRSVMVNVVNVIYDVAIRDRDDDLTYDVQLDDPSYRQQKEMCVIRTSVVTTGVMLDNHGRAISQNELADLIWRALAKEGISMAHVRVQYSETKGPDTKR